MPIKKDGTGKRWVEMEFVTPGTPEQVWEAMATVPGNTAWFTKAVIDGHVGGAAVRVWFERELVGRSNGMGTASSARLCRARMGAKVRLQSPPRSRL